MRNVFAESLIGLMVNAQESHQGHVLVASWCLSHVSHFNVIGLLETFLLLFFKFPPNPTDDGIISDVRPNLSVLQKVLYRLIGPCKLS